MMKKAFYYIFCALVLAACLVVLAFASMLKTPIALRADEPLDCNIITDMVLVAHALKLHKTNPAQTRPVLEEIYAQLLPPRLPGPKYEQYLAAAIRFAASEQLSGVPSVDVATAVHQYCMRSGGNLDMLFGTEAKLQFRLGVVSS